MTNQYLDKILAEIPFATLIGIEIEAIDPILVLRLGASKNLLGNADIDAMHGGSLSSLMETAAILASARQHIATNVTGNDTQKANDTQEKGGAEWHTQLPVPLNTTTQYLRGCKTKTTYASAEILKFGKRSSTILCKLWQDDRDKPCASMTAILMSAPQSDIAD